MKKSVTFIEGEKINLVILDKELHLALIMVGANDQGVTRFTRLTTYPVNETGEIKWIDDPLLLSLIANAFHTIQQIKEDEEKWYKAEIESDPRETLYRPGDRIRKHVVPVYPQAERIVSNTIENISKHIITTSEESKMIQPLNKAS